MTKSSDLKSDFWVDRFQDHTVVLAYISVDELQDNFFWSYYTIFFQKYNWLPGEMNVLRDPGNI